MSERQVMPVTQRAHFEASIRKVGTGFPATLDGIRQPLRVMAVAKDPPPVTTPQGSRRVDSRA